MLPYSKLFSSSLSCAFSVLIFTADLSHTFSPGNKLKSYFWDGVANYSVTGQSEAAQEEAEKQEESRLDEFGDWLENNDEELPEEFRLRTE